jgi:UDP-N-acetyl-D-glucosamine dehydrogenase
MLTEDFLHAQDCVVMVIDHSAYNYEWIVRQSSLVIDTCNATAVVEGPYAKIHKACNRRARGL